MSTGHKVRWQSAAVMLTIIILVGILDIKFLTWAFLGLILYFAIDEAVELFRVSSNIIYPMGATIWILAYFISEPINLIFLALLILAGKLAYDKSIDKLLFLPLLYPIASWLFIWSLYINFGMKSLVWLLVIVALSDVGAYYVGKSIGKTKFSSTSPNKTLEGVYGGIVIASFIGAILILSTSEIGFFYALIISILTSISSIFGDLFESYLKREAGVKDSGNLIPGHGGILDRVDGYLFASVVLYIILTIGK